MHVAINTNINNMTIGCKCVMPLHICFHFLLRCHNSSASPMPCYHLVIYSIYEYGKSVFSVYLHNFGYANSKQNLPSSLRYKRIHKKSGVLFIVSFFMYPEPRLFQLDRSLSDLPTKKVTT